MPVDCKTIPYCLRGSTPRNHRRAHGLKNSLRISTLPSWFCRPRLVREMQRKPRPGRTFAEFDTPDNCNCLRVGQAAHRPRAGPRWLSPWPRDERSRRGRTASVAGAPVPLLVGAPPVYSAINEQVPRMPEAARSGVLRFFIMTHCIASILGHALVQRGSWPGFWPRPRLQIGVPPRRADKTGHVKSAITARSAASCPYQMAIREFSREATSPRFAERAVHQAQLPPHDHAIRRLARRSVAR